MKKRLIVSAVVLVSIIIAPKIVSKKIEESLHSTIAEINSIPGYLAKIQEFKGGWFASTAKIQVGVDLIAMNPQTNAEDYTFPTEGAIVVDFNSSHGPILFGTHSGIGWLGYTVSYSGEGARDVLSWADSTALYTVTSTMGLFGGSTFADKFSSFKAAEGQPSNIDFSGYQGQGEYSGGVYSYSGASEKFEFYDVDGNLTVTGLSFDMSMLGDPFDALQGKIFDSTLNFGLSNITLEDVDGDQVFVINDLTSGFVTGVDKTANVLNAIFNYTVKEIDVMDYNTSDIVLQMEMNNLSLDFLESYRIFAREMVNFQPEELGEKTLEFVQNKFLPALITSPELNITDFHGTVPEGNFKASLFTKIMGVEALPDNLMSQAFWLQHLLANADIEMDKEVVLMLAQQQLRSQLIAQIMQNPDVAEMSVEELDEIVMQQTPIMLSTLQEQGLLTETENGYISSFELKDGNAILNGNPIPIPGM